MDKATQARESEAADIEAAAQSRFAANCNLRTAWGVPLGSKPDCAAWKNAMARYIRQELAWAEHGTRDPQAGRIRGESVNPAGERSRNMTPYEKDGRVFSVVDGQETEIQNPDVMTMARARDNMHKLAQIEKNAGDRFDRDWNLRANWGVAPSPGEAVYAAAKQRFIAAQRKWFLEQGESGHAD